MDQFVSKHLEVWAILFPVNCTIAYNISTNLSCLVNRILMLYIRSLILEVSFPMSKFQVGPMKKETSDLDSPLKVMPKYKILGQ